MLVPLNIAPGIYRNSTEYAPKGRWTDADKVRFRDGKPRKIKGWQKLRVRSGAILGACRGVHDWRHSGDVKFYTAFGTNLGLFVYNGDQIFDITPAAFVPGNVNSHYALGYGTSAYGVGAYGTARTGSALTVNATTWSLDNWGDTLVGCASHEGTIYEWADENATEATAISGAPTNNIGIIVTEERFLVALGANGNPRRVAWSDEEDYTTWTASATNKAGDFDLSDPTRIVAARQGVGQTLIWTEYGLHAMYFRGMPYVYGFERVGEHCGACGPNAMAVFNGIALWMGQNNFYVYDGRVRELDCDVYDHVFGNLSPLERVKVFCGVNHANDEVWWWYPTDTSRENDRYVVYNTRENVWSIGTMERTAWVSAGLFSFPMATDAGGNLYRHETGYDADGEPMLAFIEGGVVELANGEDVVRVKRIVPDFSSGDNTEPLTGSVDVYILTRDAAQGADRSHGPYTFTAQSTRRFTRFVGRHVRLRIESDGLSDNWSLGELRVEIEKGGKR